MGIILGVYSPLFGIERRCRMKSKTQQAIALIDADQSNDTLYVKARAAALKVGLLSWQGIAIAYNHKYLTIGQRCKCCGQIIRGQNDKANQDRSV